MLNKSFLLVSLLLIVFTIFSCSQEEPTAPEVTQSQEASALAKQGGEGDPEVLAIMNDINDELAAQGLNMAVEAIEFFTIGNGRPSNRIHQQPFRWVPNDPRRAAQGDDITYLVDQSDGATASGLSNAQTEPAIDRSMVTWDNIKALKKVDLVKRADDGSDPDIFDSFFGFGSFGNFLVADIVSAGWLPLAYFDAVVGGGPNSGCGVLAFSVTFIFTSGGVPTDINGDNYLDTALNEVYYNDDFGDPGSPCTAGTPNSTQPWGINQALPGVDVETVALHENGHSLGIGHFGPPPDAVLNPIYAGIRQTPLAPDKAGMNAIWSSWPNP